MAPPRDLFRIVRIRLVNFHNLGTATVDLPGGGHLFLLGDNGSGKTTLLDAIHYVLAPGRLEFNAAARVAGSKDAGGRKVQGIVLRYNVETGPMRERGISYAALELAALDASGEPGARRVSLCVGISAEGMDVAYDSYVNEFILGKKRIMLKPEATKDFDGAPLFDADELAFYILPEDSANSSIIREIDMKLRAAEHHAGLQDMLNLLGMKCGFGEQHYRFEPSGLKTATEVVSANSSLYRSVRKHELLLEAALKELCAILLRTGRIYFGEELDEETEITVDFDDSIIEDSGSEFERDLKMLDRGVLEKEEFRRKWNT